MRFKVFIALAFATALLTLPACGIVNAITGGNSGTVQQLWLDVPQLPESTKAELSLPLPVRLVLQQALPGKFDFIAFTTSKLPFDVINYYSVERMKVSGWNADSAGCVGEKSSADGGFCLFTRKTAAGEQRVAVVISKDGKDKPTQIFYARVDAGGK